MAAGRDRPETDWVLRLDDNRKALQATPTRGPPKIYGIETVDWTVAAKKARNWLRGINKGGGAFTASSKHKDIAAAGDRDAKEAP